MWHPTGNSVSSPVNLDMFMLALFINITICVQTTDTTSSRLLATITRFSDCEITQYYFPPIQYICRIMLIIHALLLFGADQNQHHS